jgi:ABC-type oligopeptide transport system ATPase subunit
MATDEKVQACIQREFASKTIITIAHRVNTVIDNKIIVMEQGNIAEYDSSHRLLQNPTSHLSVLVDAMGPAAAANLRQRAEYAHQSGRNSRHLSLDAAETDIQISI